MTVLTHPGARAGATNRTGDALRRSIQDIGRNANARQILLDALRAAEPHLSSAGGNVREDISRPLIDALCADAGVLTKTLSNGLTVSFLYRSKIARALVMSPQAKPDHVWEPQTTKLLLHLARDAKQIVVGGAYMGDHALLLAHAIQSHGGLVHAFEPNAEQSAMLSQNAQHNNLRNLHAHRLALWHTAGEMLACVGEDAEAHCEAPDPLVGHEVSEDLFLTTTIDDYAAQHGLEAIDVIMLDIEGGEHAALRGAERWLSRPAAEAPKIVFEIHNLYSDWSGGLENVEIVRHLRSFGYHVFAVRDHHGNLPMGDSPIEIIPPEHTHIDGPPHGFNMLAVKRIELIDDKPFRICRDVSPKLLPGRDPALHAPLDGWPNVAVGG